MTTVPKKYRKIIHIDMDAFYASVEQRDHPELRGKAIAVGGDGKRGVTTTASYEARKYGVKSAMPGWKAKELCPELIFVPPRFEAYKEASRQIRSIFHRYTDLVEPLSLDEAFLDVTINKVSEEIATKIAMQIKSDIYDETQLTASAGVSYCKFLAKIASDVQKPNGITIIKPHQAISFLEELPIQKFFGVGKVTANKMMNMGIYNGKDLKLMPKVELAKHFGKIGLFFYDIVRGHDDREVKPDRIRHSYAVERTLEENLNDIHEIKIFAEQLAEKLHNGIQKIGFKARTLTLKLKNQSFILKTRIIYSKTAILDLEEIKLKAHLLIDANADLCNDIRLIGLTLSNSESEDQIIKQLELPFD